MQRFSEAMAEVVLFNHIPKTAGSTVRYILWRTIGRDRLLTSNTPGHRDRIAEFAERLDGPLEGDFAIQAHAGCGIENHLPPMHSYPAFTFLRDPVERTMSRYYYGRDRPENTPGGLPSSMSLPEFLAEETMKSFNAQTGFLGGLWAKHNLEGLLLEREMFDRGLLEKAKRTLEGHAVVGLTERFDESLLLLHHAYGWPVRKTFYRSANAGKTRQAVSPLPEAELEAIRASNALDIELYEFASELFTARLDRLPQHQRRLRRFRRMNTAFGHFYSSVYAPGRQLATAATRRTASRRRRSWSS